ncbi:hypothetical protein KUTeg_008515 [Tegillarca granosa]|uniref:Uncharacterized protein n=1 Tax=Tegillarca granosa TaxID=220873 RepID=A0ABQ9F9A9_TEGGR|nr:hypothetical protein KUTeg_008515 [Tegillarca granosa]
MTRRQYLKMASKRKNENSHSQRASNTHNSRKKTSKRADNDDNNRKEKSNIVYYLVIAILAIAISVTHRNHIANLFENDRHFSHLSTLERELAFRTEMVVLAAAYRMYEATNAWFKRPTKMCWTVNRGQGYSPVQSCEGLGEPSYFYTEAAFTLNGIMMGIFFLFGTFLRLDQVFGGILTVASYFYNHGECTRVQWTPPLRESFAYPFFVLQMLIVTYVLKTDKLSHLQSVFIAIATISFMLPWQFAQFALMTQTVAVFGTYVLGYIGSNKIKIILYGQTMGLLFSYIALFGNEMLLTSFFASCLATVWIIVSLETVIEKIKFRILIWGVQGVLLVVGTVCLKFIIAKVLQVADDAHIGEIFKSKFTDFKNFHTMLYTCAAEFDFMQAETPWKVLKTLLSPCVAAVVLISTFIILKREYEAWKKSDLDSEDVISSGLCITCSS